MGGRIGVVVANVGGSKCQRFVSRLGHPEGHITKALAASAGNVFGTLVQDWL
jgi:hypothetical protein